MQKGCLDRLIFRGKRRDAHGDEGRGGSDRAAEIASAGEGGTIYLALGRFIGLLCRNPRHVSKAFPKEGPSRLQEKRGKRGVTRRKGKGEGLKIVLGGKKKSISNLGPWGGKKEGEKTKKKTKPWGKHIPQPKKKKRGEKKKAYSSAPAPRE